MDSSSFPKIVFFLKCLENIKKEMLVEEFIVVELEGLKCTVLV